MTGKSKDIPYSDISALSFRKLSPVTSDSLTVTFLAKGETHEYTIPAKLGPRDAPKFVDWFKQRVSTQRSEA